MCDTMSFVPAPSFFDYVQQARRHAAAAAASEPVSGSGFSSLGSLNDFRAERERAERERAEREPNFEQVLRERIENPILATIPEAPSASSRKRDPAGDWSVIMHFLGFDAGNSGHFVAAKGSPDGVPVECPRYRAGIENMSLEHRVATLTDILLSVQSVFAEKIFAELIEGEYTALRQRLDKFQGRAERSEQAEEAIEPEPKKPLHPALRALPSQKLAWRNAKKRKSDGASKVRSQVARELFFSDAEAESEDAEAEGGDQAEAEPKPKTKTQPPKMRRSSLSAPAPAQDFASGSAPDVAPAPAQDFASAQAPAQDFASALDSSERSELIDILEDSQADAQDKQVPLSQAETEIISESEAEPNGVSDAEAEADAKQVSEAKQVCDAEPNEESKSKPNDAKPDFEARAARAGLKWFGAKNPNRCGCATKRGTRCSNAALVKQGLPVCTQHARALSGL
jgi:hypothetical protein